MDRLEVDRTLDVLLDMVGVYIDPDGWWVKTEARRVQRSRTRPFGIKYSLTLHDRHGERILGYDNAHAVPGSGRVEWDHRHRFDRITPYHYVNAARLLEDFYADVDRWLENAQ